MAGQPRFECAGRAAGPQDRGTAAAGFPAAGGHPRGDAQERVARPAAAESAYPPEQFEEIKQAVTASFRAAWQRISGNRRHLEAWRDGQFGEGTQGWLLGHALDHLARTGDVPTYIRESDGTRQIRGPVMTALGGIRSEFTWQRLYLNAAEVVSLAALMVISYGWNCTPVAELAVPEVLPGPAPGEPVTYRVELEKRRRHRPHRYETRNLTDWGPNAPGRLITRAIEATSPARDLLAALGAPTTLCNPDNAAGGPASAPSLDRCQATCPNIARTDGHAQQLRAQAERLRRQADTALTPHPVADRLRQRAATLAELAGNHDRTRIALTDEESA